MRTRNLFTLETGLNEIEISFEDLGITTSQFPIAHIPAGAEIHNISFDIIEKFRSSTIENQVSPDSCIKHFMMIGTEGDTQNLLTYTGDVADNFGRTTANTGSYFSSPIVNDFDSKIYLENWISPRVWTIGGDLSTARYGLSGCGEQTAALSFGGTTGSPSSVTEEYNGSAWSAGGTLGATRQTSSGCGTQTAGLVIGGDGYVSSTEEYNGSSWSGGGALNNGITQGSACGIQTAGLSFSGGISGNVWSGVTEEYNGATWTQKSNLNIGRRGSGGCGSQTVALCFAGDASGTYTTTAEAYNGNAWYMVNNLNLARGWTEGTGTQTSALRIGGHDYTDDCEEYDGIIWTMTNNLNGILDHSAACGLQGAALNFGGYTGLLYSSRTEHYDQVDLSAIAMSGKLKLSLTVI